MMGGDITMMGEMGWDVTMMGGMGRGYHYDG